MIYTVTFNPALDYIVRLDSLEVGGTNRVTFEKVMAGGKGINVSVVLGNLGQKSTALGFIAGFTGEEVKRQLREKNVNFDFVQLPKGFTRINAKVKAETETEINGQGPNISELQWQSLITQIDKTLKSGDTLVLAGSIPNTLPDDMYERILARLYGRGVRCVVDATKKLLLNVLKFGPFLIKPNNHELEDLFDVKISTDEEYLSYAKQLQKKGAKNVLVSLGGDGAILLDEKGECHRSPAPKGTLVTSVGAGDSMVAGFLTGLAESGGDYEKAFRMGVATGSASAFSKDLATRAEVDALLAQLGN